MCRSLVVSRALRRTLVVLVLAAGMALRGAAAAAVAAPPAKPDAVLERQRLLFLLQYVGTDYDAAVRDGKVVNAFEYDEVLRLAKQLAGDYGERPDRSPAVQARLHDLVKLVESHAPADDVWTATRRLYPDLAHALGDDARPAAAPNLAAGGRLFAADCVPCHGPGGAGDGESSGGMEPPPTAFRGKLLQRLSPRQVYDAITLGVDGTAMPSYAGAYGEQQRWDVAFFVMTLRVGFEPKRIAGADVSLEKLAVASNEELLADLRRTHPGASVENVDFLRTTGGTTATAAAGGALESGNAAPSASAAAPTASGAGATRAAAPIAVARQLQDAFADVADRVLPRVVGVTSYARDPDWTGEKLRASRGDAWIAANAEAVRYPGFRPVASGSGFLVDDEGYLLSCDHLVRDARGDIAALVDVELQDQTHLPARVVGAEPSLDLAVLRVAEPARLPILGSPLEFGNSDLLQVGHWVVAVGDPPGPDKVFTVGLVSAPPARQCYQEHLSATLLQSSLVVPPPALGGPVVDISGRVVGISIGRQRPAGAPVTGAAAALPGVGDAVPDAARTLPINLVLTLFEALKVAQSVRSPWIGASVLELPALRRRLGEQADAAAIPATGLYVDDVFEPSPASRAGVRPGDFLLGLGGHPLASVSDFQTWLYVLGIGTRAELDLERDGKRMQVTVPIEVRPESAAMQ